MLEFGQNVTNNFSTSTSQEGVSLSIPDLRTCAHAELKSLPRLDFGPATWQEDGVINTQGFRSVNSTLHTSLHAHTFHDPLLLSSLPRLRCTYRASQPSACPSPCMLSCVTWLRVGMSAMRHEASRRASSEDTGSRIRAPPDLTFERGGWERLCVCGEAWM